MPKATLYGYREFKVMLDEVHFTVILVNQAGEKVRHDIEIPIDFLRSAGTTPEDWFPNDDGITLEILPIPHDADYKQNDYRNRYKETFYHVEKPLDTWQETALRYYRDHPRYPDSDDMTDEELLAKVLEDDPREPHWVGCWERQHSERYLAKYERYLKLLEEFPEDFNMSLENFNRKSWVRGKYVY